MVLTVYPMLYVTFASLSAPAELVSHSGLLMKPVGFTISTYQTAFMNPNIINGYANTLFIVLAGVFIGAIMTALAAYVLSRENVLWNKFFMLMIVFTMFFNGGMIPYRCVKRLGRSSKIKKP